MAYKRHSEKDEKSGVEQIIAMKAAFQGDSFRKQEKRIQTNKHVT